MPPRYGVNVLVGLGDLLEDAVAGSARLMTGEEILRSVTVVNLVIGIGMCTHDFGHRLVNGSKMQILQNELA